MDLKKKFLIASTLIGSILITPFTLIWGNKVSDADTNLFIFIFVEILLVILLSIDIFKRIKK